MAKLFIEDLEVKGKNVLMRVDFNVPLDDDLNVTDDTRITTALPSINRIIDNGGRAVLMSHLGRPNGEIKENLRLEPVVYHLFRLLDREVKYLKDCIGDEAEQAVAGLADGEVLLLENLRFHSGEKSNDPGFAAKLAKLGDLYVNDAFGSAHRVHASTVGVTAYFRKCAAGYLLKGEIDFLGEALKNPKKPFVAILGGAKVASKLGVINTLFSKVDALLIGGGMSYTFIKALGHSVGDSLLEEDLADTARAFIDEAKTKGVELILPEDYVITDKFDNDAQKKTVNCDQIPDGWMGMDIGPKTIDKFINVIRRAGTIFWNGPVGVFEKPNFANGTNLIAHAIAETGTFSIIGGGDSIRAVKQSGIADKITHISTGGGASLKYIEKETLPAIEALTDGQPACRRAG